MKFGVLFSGGKDSTLALHKVAAKKTVVCLITVQSLNQESYMFHTPNIGITALQAEALDLPLVTVISKGEKEAELADLEEAIKKVKETYKIEGIVTGALESVYQTQRIQRICNKLNLSCFNPLWKHDQKTLLEELVDGNFKVIISGIFAYPLDEKWLGIEITKPVIDKLVALQKKYGISPAGEGGEIETTVLDAPMFKKIIKVVESEIKIKGNSGVFIIKRAELVDKNPATHIK